MKRVYIARHPADAEMFKDLLRQQGIEAVVRGQGLFGARGEAPLTFDTLPSVWVVEDADFERARAFAARYERGLPIEERPMATWRCVKCGETIEGQFTECWRCGWSRPGGLD